MMLLATFFPASELPGGLLDIKGEFLKVSYTSNGVAKALGMSNSRNVSPLKCPSIKISGKNLEFMTYLNKHCVCVSFQITVDIVDLVGLHLVMSRTSGKA